MKLFNWLRGLFRKPRTDHGDSNDWLWFNPAEWEMKVETEGPKYTPATDTSVYGYLSDEQAAEAFQRWETKRLATKAILPGRIHLGGSSALVDWRTREQILRAEIARLRRNKKKYSHLQKELDALINSGADTQTNNGDDQ